MGSLLEKKLETEEEEKSLVEKCVNLLQAYRENICVYAVKDGSARVIGSKNGYTVFAIKPDYIVACLYDDEKETCLYIDDLRDLLEPKQSIDGE